VCVYLSIYLSIYLCIYLHLSNITYVSTGGAQGRRGGEDATGKHTTAQRAAKARGDAQAEGEVGRGIASD